jgi:nitrogen regulatory protein PII
MKAVFITYGQSLTDSVEDVLNKLHVRGFTRWTETQGRGSQQGEPHYGTHAWPSKNGTMIAIVQDHEAEHILAALRNINEQAEEQGLNAFVWDVTDKM